MVEMILYQINGKLIFGHLEGHLEEPKYVQMMDILASTHEIVEMVNDQVLSELRGINNIFKCHF